MKKKYIHYKANLLIGLLGLNVLPSCVNTRRDLSINNTGNQRTEEPPIRDSSQEDSRFSFIRSTTWSGLRYLLTLCPDPLTLIEIGVGFAAGYSLRSLYNSRTANHQLYPNVNTSKLEL